MRELLTRKRTNFPLSSAHRLHEHAHLVFGHQRTDDDKHWLLAQEKEADIFALSCLVNDLSTEEERQIAGLSLVLLCASNLYLPKDLRGIWQSAHPHLHDRLRNSIAGLNLATERAKYYLYHLASIALQQYLQEQGLALDPCLLHRL